REGGRRRRPRAAAENLPTAASAADAKLAAALKPAPRYNAACFAALAAAGQGSDADKLAFEERARLRRQARDWLRADLDLMSKRLEDGKPEDRKLVQDLLKHWQEDADLAGIRDKTALQELPAADRKACKWLMADVH